MERKKKEWKTDGKERKKKERKKDRKKEKKLLDEDKGWWATRVERNKSTKQIFVILSIFSHESRRVIFQAYTTPQGLK